MGMLDKSCLEFLDALASKAPVPGGGGAAAASGALGMALATMVGNLTVGKKKYADVENEVRDLMTKGAMVMRDLAGLVDKDAEAFAPLSRAYGMPKTTPAEIREKEEALEKCSKEACAVPLEIMRKSFEGIRIHNRMGQIGSMLAISDVGCGVVFLKSALISGMLNVVINHNTIKDAEFISTTREEMDRLLSDGSKLADETLRLVLEKLARERGTR